MVLSETRKRRANERVMAFLAAAEASSLFISALTVGELRKGVDMKRRTDPDAAAQIGNWVDGLELTFADRILPIDAPAARRWGELSADRSRPVIETLIAATALVHDCTLVTRNTSDVEDLGVPLLDPWQVVIHGT
ncbi:MAG: PIN domain-containing protein [Luteitalea sp.]|nr:PIN domain-containing protein [Luteitalea sp.]